MATTKQRLEENARRQAAIEDVIDIINGYQEQAQYYEAPPPDECDP